MTETFYASGSGDRLIDDALYPPAVHAFLDEEQGLLTRLVDRLDVLVEVGSMHGLHLDWAVAHGRSYVGLDVVDRYVAEGRRILAERGLAGDRYRFHRLPAERLADLTVPPGRALALFPFNSFGNMADPLPVLDALADSGLPFLLSTYGTDPDATRRRHEYYTACGYEDLVARQDADGVRFTAPGGLDTIAYHPPYLLARLAERGLAAAHLSFADFGAAYLSQHLCAALDQHAGGGS